MERPASKEFRDRKAFQVTTVLTVTMGHRVQKVIPVHKDHRDLPANMEQTAQPARRAMPAHQDHKGCPVTMATTERPDRKVLPGNVGPRVIQARLVPWDLKDRKDRLAQMDRTDFRDLRGNLARMVRPDQRVPRERQVHKDRAEKPVPPARLAHKVIRDQPESVGLKVPRGRLAKPAPKGQPGRKEYKDLPDRPAEEAAQDFPPPTWLRLRTSDELSTPVNGGLKWSQSVMQETPC